VRVSYRLDSFEETARDIWLQALQVIILAITAALWLLLRWLRPPMRALRAATRFAAELDHTLGENIEVSRRASEIEELGRALNQVSARLQTQNKDLNNQKFALDQHAIVSITDLNGTITYANDRFCAISGYAREELVGQNHRIVKSGFHEPIVFVELWQTITNGRVWHHEVKNRRKDGSFYWVEATIVPLLDAGGHPEQYIAIRTDITAIKELEQSLQQAKASAEAATVAKSQFLANMSHEIRTPMNGVMGMTDLALDTELDPTQRAYLETARSSAQSLMVILNDILDFSKIEAGKLNIESIEFSLASTLSEILKPIISRAEKKGLTLASELAPGLPDRVRGDPGRIRQILTNLCDNAIKFTSQGGITVALVCEASGAEGFEAHFSVQDTGIGIAADQLKGIFDAFTQADTSTTRRFGGTGLGLTICARLTELMGGRIWVKSEPGHGSSFHFTVRLERRLTTRTAAQAQPAGHGLAAPQRALRVMLAEDHPVNQLLATTLLKKWGHQVVLAENGQQVLDLFPTQRWDMILMDMQMPIMGGLEATQRIRALEAGAQHTPIIAVTANAMEADRLACLEVGMDGFLSKPVNAAALQAVLAQCSTTEKNSWLLVNTAVSPVDTAQVATNMIAVEAAKPPQPDGLLPGSVP
jgi:PAS domain S-box-containing protein